MQRDVKTTQIAGGSHTEWQEKRLDLKTWMYKPAYWEHIQKWKVRQVGHIARQQQLPIQSFGETMWTEETHFANLRVNGENLKQIVNVLRITVNWLSTGTSNKILWIR